ncbi:MAG: SPFH domain-containing protein [Verrucomicrobiota bacterium]|nr:SPFH domain-containing protein [Verrucomicrobiota bacterium]
MLFWSHFRSGPTDWACKLKKGEIRQQGLGISFYYMPEFVTVLRVPTGITSTDFSFTERTSDYQIVHVQGVLTWKINQPEKAARMLDFSVDVRGNPLSEDPRKLEEKCQHLVAVLGRNVLKELPLEESLKAAEQLGRQIAEGLRTESYITSVGMEILSLDILAVKPEPEVARALESAKREALLKQQDDATAQRRLSALENERIINDREAGNELSKEKASRTVSATREEHKKLEQLHEQSLAQQKLESDILRNTKEAESRQKLIITDARVTVEKQQILTSTEMQFQREVAEQKRSMLLADAKATADREQVLMSSQLELAEESKKLADARLEVAHKEAEAEKARVAVVFDALRSLTSDQLQSLSLMGAQPGVTIATAFQKLAERAHTIGHLNITPDLLNSIIQSDRNTKPQ